jgi:flagellar hook-basal body complex protein FliE
MSAPSPFGSIEPLRSSISPFQTSPVSIGKGFAGTDQAQEKGGTFQNIFAKAMDSANEACWTAGDDSDKLVSGRLENLHDMTINSAKAEVMLHLATQMCSKLSSATTTLFQMQL